MSDIQFPADLDDFEKKSLVAGEGFYHGLYWFVVGAVTVLTALAVGWAFWEYLPPLLSG